MAVQIVILLLLILTCGLISVILANQMPDNGSSGVSVYISPPSPLRQTNSYGNYPYSWLSFYYAEDEAAKQFGQLRNDSQNTNPWIENTSPGLIDHIAQIPFTFEYNLSRPINGSQLYTPNFISASSYDEGKREMFAAFQALYDCQDNNRYSYAIDRCSNVTLIQAGVYNVREVSLEGKQRKLAYDYLPLFDDYSYYYLPFDSNVLAPVMTFLLHNAGFAHMQNETFSWNNGNGIQTALGSMNIDFGNIGLVNVINASIQANLLSCVLFLLTPLFMFKMVAERNSGIMEINRLMGLTPATYWTANYIHDYVVYLFVLAVVIIAGIAFRMILFVQFNFELLAVAFIWGHAQISLAYFLGMIFSNWPLALVFCYGLAFIQLGIAAAFNYAVFATNALPPAWYNLWPGFAFYRTVMINAHVISNPAMTGGAAAALSNSWILIGWIVGASTVILLLAIYLDQVLPKELGSARPFYFPFTWCRSGKKFDVYERHADEDKPLLIEEDEIHDGSSREDDVEREADNVLRDNIPRDSPLVVKQISKKFPGATGDKPIVAVNNVSFHVRRNDCFGLLGSNGAGKTTLVNMLSGLLPVTSGEAFVGGYQLTRDLGKIQSRIGVCLQKDILWEDLTVEEHLLFYSRMKGIERKIEKEHVHNIIVEVGLEGERRRLAGDLSGGQKRRLSIAISLMGEPDVIFLDEPSSGLDPGNRRGLWQVIEKIRENRCLLLTTHSMEEAEALCTRIAIQSLGRMKTIGTQHQLKRKYGTFYKIEFITEEDRHQDVQRLLVNVNANPELIEKNSTAVTFKVSKEVNLSALVKVIEAQRKPMHIKNWGFSESNLEDIFLTIVMKDEEKISLVEAKRGHEHSVDNTLV